MEIFSPSEFGPVDMSEYAVNMSEYAVNISKYILGFVIWGGREDRRAYRTSKNGGKSQKISPLKNWPNMSEYVRICQNMGAIRVRIRVGAYSVLVFDVYFDVFRLVVCIQRISERIRGVFRRRM